MRSLPRAVFGFALESISMRLSTGKITLGPHIVNLPLFSVYTRDNLSLHSRLLTSCLRPLHIQVTLQFYTI